MTGSRKDPAAALRALLERGTLDLPPIAGGDTAARWHALVEIARADVSVGRLAEAHVDGTQILHEAARTHPSDRLLGVWASDSLRHSLTVETIAHRLVLRGSKAFCTGAGIVDDALVTAAGPDGPLLLLVDVATLDPARIDTTSWQAPALAETCTGVVDFDGIEMSPGAAVGAAGWYLDRPGFWHGAIGPAACWAGAALGLVDYAVAHPPDDPHGRAHLGAMEGAAWAMRTALTSAGSEIDAQADDVAAAHRRALIVRHLVDDRCRDVQDRFARALGPRPLVHDARIAERNEASTVYRRQCHAERDLEALGNLVINPCGDAP